MSRTLVKAFSLGVLFFVTATLTFSQTTKGQFSGQVTDPQGLAVPQATVEIVNKDTSAKRETKTDEGGRYTVAGLPGGRYQVTVQAEGFTPFSSEDITLATDQAFVLDVKLAVFQQVESITVQGSGAAEIETSNAEVEGTIKQTEVESYGLNGRVTSQLIALLPGSAARQDRTKARRARQEARSTA